MYSRALSWQSHFRPFYPILFLAVAGLGSLSRSVAGAPRQTASAPLSQARINEVAARLENARRACIEDTGLRRLGEPLDQYVARIAGPLPGENRERYGARMEAYVVALERAAAATALYRQMPAVLQDRSAANRAVWHSIATALTAFPSRTASLRRNWQIQKRGASSNQISPTPATLTSAWTQTLRIALVALDGLRDARP